MIRIRRIHYRIIQPIEYGIAQPVEWSNILWVRVLGSIIIRKNIELRVRVLGSSNIIRKKIE